MNMLNMSPRQALITIVKHNPTASEREIGAQFWKFLCKNENLPIKREIVRVWMMREYRSLDIVRKPGSIAVMTVPPIPRPSTQRKRAQRTVAAITQAVLMDFVLSNGKLLRNATFAECKREGGWLIDIAKNGKPQELVGRVLTEQQLRNLRMRNS